MRKTSACSAMPRILRCANAIVSLKGRVLVPLHVAFPRVEIRKGMVQDEDISIKAGKTAPGTIL